MAQVPQPYQPNEWDQPGEPGSDPSAAPRRAALFVWLTGAVLIVLFSCIISGMLVLTSIPEAELKAQDIGLSAAQLQQLDQLRSLIWPALVTTLLLGLAPGVAYLFLGFGVRAGRKIPTTLAQLLILCQSIVLGMALANSIFLAIKIANPVALTFNVLTAGSLLALLIYTFLCLTRAKAGQRFNDELQSDPWNPRNPPNHPE